eukprot:1048568_1
MAEVQISTNDTNKGETVGETNGVQALYDTQSAKTDIVAADGILGDPLAEYDGTEARISGDNAGELLESSSSQDLYNAYGTNDGIVDKATEAGNGMRIARCAQCGKESDGKTSDEDDIFIVSNVGTRMKRMMLCMK